jgi:hypothetical protein
MHSLFLLSILVIENTEETILNLTHDSLFDITLLFVIGGSVTGIVW